MAPTRACLTCKDGALYANDKAAAEAVIARFFGGWTFEDRAGNGIAKTFESKVKLVTDEMASQAASYTLLSLSWKHWQIGFMSCVRRVVCFFF